MHSPLQTAGQIGVIGCQVKVAVAGEIEDDRLAFTGFLAGQSLGHRAQTACAVSGAGKIPSALVKLNAASKIAVCVVFQTSMSPAFFRALTCALIP